MPKTKSFSEATKSWRLLLAADIVVFAFLENKLKVLLVRRRFEPGVGQWAIPGGFVREEESLEAAALRELQEETGLKQSSYLEQLYTFGEVKRDPRARVISVSYIHLINHPEKLNLKASDDAAEVKWFDINSLPALSFGKAHRDILEYAWQRLKWKLEYSNVALSMLPEKFTLTELQRLYEAVYHKKIDKRNFRKKILAIDFVEPIDAVKQEMGRPAQLYKAATSKMKMYNHVV